MLEAEMQLFARRYARPAPAPARGDPNDRRYCRAAERRAKRMRPEYLDALLRGEDR